VSGPGYCRVRLKVIKVIKVTKVIKVMKVMKMANIVGARRGMFFTGTG
jgi:hypothetical protein